MKTKAFTLIEMIIAMSLMGLVLVGGGKLYHHLSGMVLTYQSQQESSLQRLQGQRILQQDLLESIAIQDMTDSTFCLKKHAFEEPVCYARRDGFWMREGAGGRDTIGGGESIMGLVFIVR